jgi:hypothetical protein
MALASNPGCDEFPTAAGWEMAPVHPVPGTSTAPIVDAQPLVTNALQVALQDKDPLVYPLVMHVWALRSVPSHVSVPSR